MMGLSPSELYELELREFFSIHAGWMKAEEQKQRHAWEVARFTAASIIAPWMDKARNMYQLLPLPWDPAQEGHSRPLDYDPDDMDARRAHVDKILKEIKR